MEGQRLPVKSALGRHPILPTEDIVLNSTSRSRWLAAGAAAGLAVGAAACGLGYFWSARVGSMEPLEGVFWWMFTLTLPLSLLGMSSASLIPGVAGAWFSWALQFFVIPILEGTVIAFVIWYARGYFRRRKAVPPAA
jgi:hypothetical protein